MKENLEEKYAKDLQEMMDIMEDGYDQDGNELTSTNMAWMIREKQKKLARFSFMEDALKSAENDFKEAEKRDEQIYR